MVRCERCGHYHGYLTSGDVYWERCGALHYLPGGGIGRCTCCDQATAYLPPPPHPTFRAAA